MRAIKHFKILWIINILILITSISFAQQNNCAFKLEEAEKYYETGIFDSIPALLRPCIESGFADEELSRAYKLLILTYLFEDYREMAEFNMLKFLKKFPEYQIKANDPVEFTYLFNSYKTIPVYSIGILAGVNYSLIRLIEPYTTANTQLEKGEYTTSGTGYQFGLQLKRYINEKIELNIDGIYTNKQFEYNINQLNSKINYNEIQNTLTLQISGTYDFSVKKLIVYGRLGLAADYVLNAKANIERIFTGPIIKEDLTGSELDIIEDRNNINPSVVIGTGIKYKTKMGYLMLDLRYNIGIANYVNQENRFANNEKIWYYNYVDSDFTINNLYISAGYVFSFYKTIKIN